jgi:hypothetical protein
MIRVIISMAILLLFARLGQAGPTVITLKKEQLGALSAAIHQMQQIKRSYKGQQVAIEDKGDVFYVSFFDDPINIAVAGDQNGIGWVVRKKDQKVLRPFLIR